jgi:hypothetical protein
MKSKAEVHFLPSKAITKATCVCANFEYSTSAPKVSEKHNVSHLKSQLTGKIVVAISDCGKRSTIGDWSGGVVDAQSVGGGGAMVVGVGDWWLWMEMMDGMACGGVCVCVCVCVWGVLWCAGLMCVVCRGHVMCG